MPAFRPNIAIVEPNADLRDALTFLLKIEFGVAVAAAGSIDELPPKSFGVVIFGDTAPSPDGATSLVNSLRARQPTAFLLRLCEDDDDAGADFAIPRSPVDACRLIACLRSLAQDDRPGKLTAQR